MQLGIIGLGRMGGNIARRLMLNGHTTVVYDRNTAFVDTLAAEGATGVADLPALVAGLASFAGIRRRLDRLTTTSAIPVIEGFGSSYEKAHSAIGAMRLHYPSRPLVVVFEPHTFSWRSRDALSWYDTVFSGASRVLICPPPVHGADSHHQSSHEEIVARTRAAGVTVEAVASPEQAIAALSDLNGDEVVLLLSSGPLLGLPGSLPPVFDRLYGQPAYA